MKEITGLADERKEDRVGSWLEGQSLPTFPVDRVDVWRVSLDASLKAESSPNILSPDEIARAGRFHFDKDRNRFTRCRSALRTLLASYLAIPASEISFQYSDGGKPRLMTERNPQALEFNVSHSGNLALIAVGSKYRLGVDIEKIRDDVDTTALAERFFSPRERTELQALPDHRRVAGFFACWTRKEAFLKATGDGLCFPLSGFSVITDPDRDPVIEEIRGNREVTKQWFLADLSVADGYRATVAVEAAFSRLQTYTYA
jgi:4'-phosphopantetheinyl transferase